MAKESKKLRREKRHQRNKKKEEEYKKEAWESGKKLIEENHNNNPYSSNYSEELGRRLYNILQGIYEKSLQFSEDKDQKDYILIRFRSYRKKIQDFILHYNPELPKTEEYEFLKNILEIYWDRPGDLGKELIIQMKND